MFAMSFVLFAVAALGPSSTNGNHLCCLPDQFTAKIDTSFSESLAVNGNSEINVYLTDYTLQYDGINKQIVYDTQYNYNPNQFNFPKPTEKRHFRVIQDYTTNVQYAIDLVKGTCATDKLNQPFHQICQDERVRGNEVTPFNTLQVNATIQPNITVQFQLTLGPCSWISPTVAPEYVKLMETFNKLLPSDDKISKTNQPFASGKSSYCTPEFSKTTEDVVFITMRKTNTSMFEIPPICR